MKWMMMVMALSFVATTPVCAQEDASERGAGEARITRALRRYRGEPSSSALVRAALVARSASPGRIRDAMDRARGTGWLPLTRLAIRRGQAVDLRGLAAEPADTNISTDDDLTLEARLVFRFDRIVFASEEVGLLRELRAAEAEQRELSSLVVRLYFERRRLQLERDLAHARDLARQIRILEIEALLDAFTAGAFSRIMGRRRGDR